MPRNWKYAAKVMGCIGRQGRGKSFLQRSIIHNFSAAWKIGFDHKGEFSELLPAPRCRNYYQCLAALEQTQSCVFDPRPMFGGDYEAAFEDFCGKMYPVMTELPGPKLFFYDEHQILAPDNWSLFKKHPLHKICTDGRSWEINVLLAAHAPTDIVLKFRNQLTHWFVFNLGCEEAAEPLKQYGYTWEAINALEIGEFIAYDHNSGELFPKQKTSKR